MQRELYSLLGENTPPVAVFESKFKERPTWKQKTSPWSWAPFKNPARNDDLVLHHWIRGKYDEDPTEYQFAKYNTDISIPEFTEEIYKQHLEDSDWTYEETRYLFDLCQDYSLRWVVIFDRYFFPSQQQKAANAGVEMADATTDKPTIKSEDEAKPSSADGNASENSDKKDEPSKVESKNEEPTKELALTKKSISAPRTLEDLKSRFYDIGRRLLKMRHKNGEAMGAAEEELYKQMKYSKEHEVKRKQHLERLLSRSPAEIAEEEALVLESRKLETAAEMMLQERQEIMRLLDAPLSNAKITQYQTSQGLAALTNTLLTSDKGKKRKDTPGSSNTPISGSPPPEGPGSPPRAAAEKTGSTKGTKRSADEMAGTKSAGAGSTAADGTPKGGVKNKKIKDKEPAKKGAAAGAAAVANVIQRKLTPKEEAAYGISYHDKLTAGVYLRSTKIATYKQVVQQKMNQILAELDIPARPVMPTGKVCAKFDSLQHSISVLLEAKKQADKLETEIRILRMQKGYPSAGGASSEGGSKE